MQQEPHSLVTHSVGAKTPAQKREHDRHHGGWAYRHSPTMDWPKGTALPETRVLASRRVKVAELPEGFLNQRHIEHLEQNQKIKHCCRHPENHEVEAFRSHPEEAAPDIYHFHCTCGNVHRFFCVGNGERPEWK